MANLYRANTVHTPAGLPELAEALYVVADTEALAFDALKAALELAGETVQSIDTPKEIGPIYTGSGSDVFVWDSEVLLAGNTHSTTRQRISTGDTEAAALTAVDDQEVLDGNTVLAVSRITKDPLTGDPLDGSTVLLDGIYTLVLTAGIQATLSAGGGVAGFDIGFELIASDGAERSGNIQCDVDGDDVARLVDLSDTYIFSITGNPQYRIPVANLAFPTVAPDKFQEGFRQAGSNRVSSNGAICENINRVNFTLITRYWQESSGAAQRLIHGLMTNTLTAEYSTGGFDELELTFVGTPGATLTLTGIPENQMLTVVQRYDGTTAFAACYDEDGVTLLDSDSLATTFLPSGNDMSLGSMEGRIKRVAYLNEFVSDADLPALLALILTNDPLPVAA